MGKYFPSLVHGEHARTRISDVRTHPLGQPEVRRGGFVGAVMVSERVCELVAVK